MDELYNSQEGDLFVHFVGCLTSKQHACVSQARICFDKFTRCHPDTEAAELTFQYTDIGPNSPSSDTIMPGV